MKSLLREAIETIVLALLIFIALQFSVQNYRVEGSSMAPTLQQDQHVLVNKVVYFHIDPQIVSKSVPFFTVSRTEQLFPFHPPRRGDIVVFDFERCHPSRSCVKRIIAVPGDMVQIEDGRVYVNGSLLEEPFIKEGGNSSMAPLRVPQDAYFVMGDNRRASNDSRYWGLLPMNSIVGKAWIAYWPFTQWHFLQVLHK
ncbi:MAG: signal peptidase I [Chloroflexi bacterium]|nr:signal peptidase I [Chloroflexota bacterium]